MTDIDGREAGLAAGTPASHSVSWWPVHTFIEALVAQANCGPIPCAGTPSWCALADGDFRKLVALAIAGEHHVLRVETAQETAAEASKSIAAATDWPAIARRLRQGRGHAYIARKESA